MKLKVADTYQITMLVESKKQPQIDMKHYGVFTNVDIGGEDVVVVEYTCNPIEVIEMTIAPEEATDESL